MSLLLQKIQQKPVYVRKILMIISVAVCASLIFAFWLNSIKNTILQAGQSEQNPETTTGQQTTMPSFKQTIISSITDIFHLLKTGKEKFQEIRSAPQTIPEQNPESETLPQSNEILPKIKPHQLP